MKPNPGCNATVMSSVSGVLGVSNARMEPAICYLDTEPRNKHCMPLRLTTGPRHELLVRRVGLVHLVDGNAVRIQLKHRFTSRRTHHKRWGDEAWRKLRHGSHGRRGRTQLAGAAAGGREGWRGKNWGKRWWRIRSRSRFGDRKRGGDHLRGGCPPVSVVHLRRSGSANTGRGGNMTGAIVRGRCRNTVRKERIVGWCCAAGGTHCR